MKDFIHIAAQGDLLIRKINLIPDNAKLVDTKGKDFVLAHSETGHNHVIDYSNNVKMFSTGDPMISYLEVIEATDKMETVIKHLRNYDTHESIKVNPGIYEVRRQREYTPEGWRRVED
jgi:hypothetical protein